MLQQLQQHREVEGRYFSQQYSCFWNIWLVDFGFGGSGWLFKRVVNLTEDGLHLNLGNLYRLYVTGGEKHVLCCGAIIVPQKTEWYER
jgi:hypothetical protein